MLLYARAGTSAAAGLFVVPFCVAGFFATTRSSASHLRFSGSVASSTGTSGSLAGFLVAGALGETFALAETLAFAFELGAFGLGVAFALGSGVVGAGAGFALGSALAGTLEACSSSDKSSTAFSGMASKQGKKLVSNEAKSALIGKHFEI